jgi:uncharacterized phage-associated protein
MRTPERPRPGPRLKFRPKLDKIVELLVYLAHKRPNADQYQAVKFLYLADKEHFNRYGRPITFETYYALDYGPVATNALDMIKGKGNVLRDAGLEALPIKMDKRANIIYLVSPLRAVDLDVFSKSDLEIFDKVLKEHGQKSFDELYKLTHSHFAYDVAWRTRREGNRALMFYEDMLDESARKNAILDAVEPISQNMR